MNMPSSTSSSVSSSHHKHRNERSRGRSSSRDCGEAEAKESNAINCDGDSYREDSGNIRCKGWGGGGGMKKERKQEMTTGKGQSKVGDRERKKDRYRKNHSRNNDERRGDYRRRRSRKHSKSSSRKRKPSSNRHSDRRDKPKRNRRSRSSSSESFSGSSSSKSSCSSSSSTSDSSSRYRRSKKKKSSKKATPQTRDKHLSSAKKSMTNVQINERLLDKLSRRNETLEEREERRAKRRAARITARFGYTAEDNPFRDPNLHEMFSWKKKEEQQIKKQPSGVEGGEMAVGKSITSRRDMQEHTFAEIEKVRQRREARELHLEEMERIRAEESKMKELENYDEWARKEEEFHLQQQRQRSAIRLVEGREKPVDVLAQNMLMFGLSEEEKENRAKVKYREKYSALEELETLEANLEEPYSLLKDLKFGELEELLLDVDAFRSLEKEASGGLHNQGEGKVEESGEEKRNENPVIRYWDALYTVTSDEIQYLKTGGEGGGHASLVNDIRDMFNGQSLNDLLEMKLDIERKLRGASNEATPRFDENGVVDTDYWQTVLSQLEVHLAKMELSDIHSKMLVRQLEKLEVKREELRKKAASGDSVKDDQRQNDSYVEPSSGMSTSAPPHGIEPDFGNLEEELGLTDEINLTDKDGAQLIYAWQDKYRPRKPRYFNRVKTGYDWNAYNKTHYDHDNPPPKIVQGYKFNIFYPDLIDKTKTPQYFLEKADTDNFCILRFSAGPPYEDVAFKIINRQWNKSRKRGFRCTFERGVLSLYFNFASHWYRR